MTRGGCGDSELVMLNVGGRLFTTTRATLTKHPNSMLAAMFRGDMQASKLHDAQGHPFIDRDPTHFPTILAFLRDGRVPALPEGRLDRQQLTTEATFYAMTELLEALQEAEAADAEAEAVEDARRRRAEAAEEAEREHAEARRFLDAQRAQQAAEAVEAVQRAEGKLAAAQEALAPLREAEEQLEAWRQLLIGAEQENNQRALEGQPPDAERQEAQEQARAQVDNWRRARLQRQEEAAPALQAEREAEGDLWRAHIARLCALGSDFETARVQLAATHPHLGPRYHRGR